MRPTGEGSSDLGISRVFLGFMTIFGRGGQQFPVICEVIPQYHVHKHTDRNARALQAHTVRAEPLQHVRIVGLDDYLHTAIMRKRITATQYARERAVNQF